MTLLRALYLHIEDQTHLAPSTVASYRYDARQIVKAHGGDAQLGQVNWGQVIAVLYPEQTRGAWHLVFRFLNWLGH
jgi:hypothetical protein